LKIPGRGGSMDMATRLGDGAALAEAKAFNWILQ
jgi:hypothetical protein